MISKGLSIGFGMGFRIIFGVIGADSTHIASESSLELTVDFFATEALLLVGLAIDELKQRISLMK